ncbi:Daunorubicin/doxorubicin resistance ATP-binding protein DrrA [subsurface metagenome]
MEAIQTFKLTRRFNSLVAVNSIDLTIEQGELFSLLGPNGAGKTTTINMLCCLLKPTKGTAQVMGADIIKEPFKVKETIGVSPQETAISERLNSWENLALISEIHGMSSSEVRRRSGEVLEVMGLMGRGKDRVGKLSGGMKRRLSIAMAMVHDPSILFLDEPTLGLDPQARRAMWEHITQLKGRKTILLTTHYMEEADFLSDKVAIIDEGRIVAEGTPRELKANFLKTRSMLVLAENITPKIMQGLKGKYFQVEEVEGKLRISDEKLDFRELTNYLHSNGAVVRSAALEEPTLEDVFIQLTGKELRE